MNRIEHLLECLEATPPAATVPELIPLDQLDRLDKWIKEFIDVAICKRAALQPNNPLVVDIDDARWLAGLLQELRALRKRYLPAPPTATDGFVRVPKDLLQRLADVRSKAATVETSQIFHDTMDQLDELLAAAPQSGKKEDVS